MPIIQALEPSSQLPLEHSKIVAGFGACDPVQETIPATYWWESWTVLVPKELVWCIQVYLYDYQAD